MSVRQWPRWWQVVVFGAALLAGAPAPGAETATPAPRAPETEARMRRDITFLASDECEGRGPGTAGIEKAADFIAAEFKKAGLQPGNPDGSYFQPFSINGARLLAPARLALKGPQGQEIDLRQGVQLHPMGLGHSGKVTGGLVFAGYGLTSKELKYDDYEGLDVEDKVVVVLRDLPRAGYFKELERLVASDKKVEAYLPVNAILQRKLATFTEKLANAEKHKAAAVLFVNDAETARTGDDLLDFNFTALARINPPPKLPALHVRRSVVETMLRGRSVELADLERAIDRDLKPHSLDLDGWTASLEVRAQRSQDAITLKNVVGVLEGAGPLAKETVIVGAHYDHLGYGGFASLGGLKKMAIHHGADDNGSGTTSVLELARRFGAMPKRQGRRLVFMTFSGEELGLFGSAHYCKKPLFPLADTVAMVNLDMVGRARPGAEGKDRVQVLGTDTAKEFGALIDAVARGHDLKLQKSASSGSRYFAASDHYSFYQTKVPVFFFFTGDHADYHRPSDTADKINVPGMRRVADLTGDLVARLATAPERPHFTPLPTRGSPTGHSPRLGIQPKVGGGEDGVLIDTVDPAGPAGKAGLKEGDRLVEIGGKPVKTLQNLLVLMSTQKAGDTVEVAIVRDGKKQVVKVVLAAPADMPRLGIRPDYSDDKEGVLVSGVTDGLPAAKAGLKEGDRIVELGGKAVKDLETYMEVLSTQKKGTVVQVGILRGGKKVNVEVRLE